MTPAPCPLKLKAIKSEPQHPLPVEGVKASKAAPPSPGKTCTGRSEGDSKTASCDPRSVGFAQEVMNGFCRPSGNAW